MEERVDRNRALAHINQALCNTDDEQTIGFLVIVPCKLSEHLSKTRVVRPGADETHGEYGVESDLEVVVVGVFGEGVEDGELRI